MADITPHSTSTPTSLAGASFAAHSESAALLRELASCHRMDGAEADQKVKECAQKLRDLIPASLQAFAEKSSLVQSDRLTQFIKAVGDKSIPAKISDQITEPTAHGFENQQTAIEGLALLRRTWSGVLDVRFSNLNGVTEVQIFPEGQNPIQAGEVKVFCITPKREFHNEVMSILPDVLLRTPNIQVLGHGETGIKLSVASGIDASSYLPAELRDKCWVEPVAQFDLVASIY